MDNRYFRYVNQPWFILDRCLDEIFTTKKLFDSEMWSRHYTIARDRAKSLKFNKSDAYKQRSKKSWFGAADFFPDDEKMEKPKKVQKTKNEGKKRRGSFKYNLRKVNVNYLPYGSPFIPGHSNIFPNPTLYHFRGSGTRRGMRGSRGLRRGRGRGFRGR